MGVRGLTTFVEENSNAYLKPYELSNSYLVVDGNSTLCSLYRGKSESDSAFGGDYDEFYKVIKSFFLLLKQCKITPIVLLDGGHEKRKEKTVLSRAESKIPIVRSFGRGFSKAVVFPLLSKETFIDVMKELGIFCVQTEKEADVEIAAISRALNCPILSYDSDFFIFDVLYIPFPSVCTKPVKFNNSNNYFLKCSLFDATNFLKDFPGLDKSLLPILATLLGNDYVATSLFKKFYNHVIIVKKKNMTPRQRVVLGVLHWLKKENVESAIKLVLNHLKSKNEYRLLKAIQMSIQYYTSYYVSESVYNKLISKIKNKNIDLNTKHFEVSLPPEIMQNFSECRVNQLVLDIISLGLYFTPLQVEQLHESSHFPAVELITSICEILSPYMQDRERLVKLYMVIHKHYSAAKLKLDQYNNLKEFSLHKVVKEPKEIRLKWLCTIVGIDEDKLSFVSHNHWSIFILSILYWIEKLNNFVSLAHIHALILMAIANEAVQKFVGYHRKYSTFSKSYGKLLQSLKNTPITVGSDEDFDKMLENVTLYEKLLVQNALIPFRQTTAGAGKGYCISTIHLFSAFQSCLYHIMVLNTLLNFPLPHTRISDFYSGTLLFNIYLTIKNKRAVEKFGCDLFKNTPNLARIYRHLCEGLCKSSDIVVPEKKTKKKKRKVRRKIEEILEVEEHQPSADEEFAEFDEYDDENNLYAILQNCRI